MRSYDQLLDENARLRALVSSQAQQLAEQQEQLALLAGLREQVARLEALVQRQAEVIRQQAAEIDRLKRRGKRQAAPFSKGSPKAQPKKPGRKPLLVPKPHREPPAET